MKEPSRFPGSDFIADPVINRRYHIDILAERSNIWPWIVQMGYHRAGWYIDAWWDRVIIEQFWARVVPEEARPVYRPPADTILPEYQDLSLGDIVPDGPTGSAYYDVVGLEKDHLLLLYATSHFNYMAPRFVYRTRLAPRGAFCWAFILSDVSPGTSRLTSWWQAQLQPRAGALLFRPVLALVDRAHQRQILRGVKWRAESQRGLFGA
jgi:hypothetical protein